MTQQGCCTSELINSPTSAMTAHKPLLTVTRGGHQGFLMITEAGNERYFALLHSSPRSVSQANTETDRHVQTGIKETQSTQSILPSEPFHG